MKSCAANGIWTKPISRNGDTVIASAMARVTVGR